MAEHTLLGFTQPASLNRWPLRDADGNELQITPSLLASSGETLRQPVHALYYRNTQLAARIACFLDFMSARRAQVITP